MTDNALRDAAVAAALVKNWQEAIAVNKQILLTSPKNIEALNRLGYAYLVTGKPTLSKQMFEKVLKLDPYNRIAENNLRKISSLKKIGVDGIISTPVSPLLFLEEPGKTKIADCINVASAEVLSTLMCGQEVFFKLKKHSIDIRDQNGVYIGALPDDISHKLLVFIDGGNTYSAYIKRIAKTCVTVFIRETHRGKKFQNQSSFNGSTNYLPYTKDHEIDQKTETDNIPEQEEES